MIRKIIGVTVGTTLNPQKISGNAEHSHSWNDLKDKPFYEEEGSSVTFEFNGDISGKETAPFKNDPEATEIDYLVKISDADPNKECFVGGTLVLTADGEDSSVALTEEMVNSGAVDLKTWFGESVEGSGYLFGGVIVVAHDTVTIPKEITCIGEDNVLTKGMWTYYNASTQHYVKSITYGTPGSIKQLDEKFIPILNDTEAYALPETVFTSEDVVGNGMVFAAQSPINFVLEKDKVYTVVWDGVEYECKAEYFPDDDNDGFNTYALGSVGYDGVNYKEPFLVVSQVSVDTGNVVLCLFQCLADKAPTEHTCSVKSGCTVIKEKYIPDTVATKEYVDQLLGASIEEIASLVGGDA